ncbi:hypothetical protein F4810DRAFT_712459 [Camillea tinctor]|nr:hypothetical protein F4810DRAFT_712459 [Camillea tinctor]
MDSSAPSQPPASAPYALPNNPVTSNPAESRIAHQQQQHSHAAPTEHRLPPSTKGSISEATPSSLGYGHAGDGKLASVTGVGAGTGTGIGAGRTGELDGDQMCAPGEGAVAGAVERKEGGGGREPDLAGGLEREIKLRMTDFKMCGYRKKQEQAAAREAVKEDRRRGVVADGGGGDLRAGVDT